MPDENGILGFFSDKLQAAANGQIDDFSSILLALATIGVIAFAIIEAIKAFPVREFVNTRFIDHFIKTRASQWDGVTADSASSELEMLAIGGQGSILYMLPIEKLAGQLNAASQTALAYPATYSTTIKVLASLAKNNQTVSADINRVVQGAPDPSDSDAVKDYTAARTRVSSLIQRNLDSIQIYTSRWWVLGNQIAAIVISIVLLYALTEQPEDTFSKIRWFFIVAFGGMIAPVAKDILAKLKKPTA